MKIGYDKFLHALIGMMIFLCGWVFINIQVGLTAVVMIGILKELSDVFGLTQLAIPNTKRNFDYWDFIATIILPIIIYAIVNP